MKQRQVSGITKLLYVLGAIVIFLLLFVFGDKINSFSESVFNPQTNDESTSFVRPDGLRINEVVTKNDTSLVDGDGEYPDWIELYNAGNDSINLRGTGLSTNIEKPYAWKFEEDLFLEPGEFMIVFASKKDYVDSLGYYHTNFKLSSDGEPLYLTAPGGGKVYSTLNIPALDADVSYGYTGVGEEWLFYSVATPNAENIEDGHQIVDYDDTNAVLKITEYMTSNKSVKYDEDGDYNDWFEITNVSQEPINLAGYCVSDDINDPQKWTLPNVTIESGEVFLIFASGKDIYGTNNHANFALAEGETITIATLKGDIVNSVNVQLLPDDISYGLVMDTWYYFAEPTPGKINNTHYYASVEEMTDSFNDVVFNEVMGFNLTAYKDADGNFPDWIEFKNTTGQAINLAGYYVSDNKDNPEKYVFPDFIIEANSTKLLLCDKDLSIENPEKYAGFSIPKGGEKLYLFSPSKLLLTEYNTGFMYNDISSGLNSEGARVFFDEPTPNAENTTQQYMSYAPAVEFNIESGEVPAGTVIELFADSATIYYTLDGSTPTEDSDIYSSAITVNEPTVIRAFSVKPNCLPSTIESNTYIAGVEHDIPIMSLSTNQENMYGPNGIYENWSDTIENPVHIEFFENDGLAFDIDAGFEIYGSTSQEEEQKSFAIHMRKEYGQSELAYKLFEGNDVDTFKHFLLRTSGQDWRCAKLRDTFFQEAVQDVIDVDAMDSRPCAVYINGEYWGLYWIREKVNEDYIESHHGVDADNIDMLWSNGAVMEGSNDDYRDLIDYVKTHDLGIQENYEYVKTQVDIDEFINYQIIQSYFVNTDNGNIKFWREKEVGQWRWIMFDFDWALYNSTYQWNWLEEIFDPNGTGAHKLFETALQVNLLDSEEFCDQFVETYAEYMNTYFLPERLVPILDEMEASIANEMVLHIERWGQPSSYERWQSNVDVVRNALYYRQEKDRAVLKEFFNLSDARMSELFPDD